MKSHTPSHRLTVAAVGILALVVTFMLPSTAVAHGNAPDRSGRGHAAVQVYRVALDQLNDSGVNGRAILIQRGEDLRVIIVARGLEPGMLHVQHIHGLDGDTEATCPTAEAADDVTGAPELASDPDEFISIGEGLPSYGPVLLPLTPFPDAAPAGVVVYNETFTVSGDLADLSDEAIVLHGMTLDGGYSATLPVACGAIG